MTNLISLKQHFTPELILIFGIIILLFYSFRKNIVHACIGVGILLLTAFSIQGVLIYCLVALAVLITCHVIKVDEGIVSAGVALLTFAAALFVVISDSLGGTFQAQTLFNGMIVTDHMSQFFKTIIFGSAMVAVVLSSHSKDLAKSPKIEFYAFLVALTLGLSMMSVSNNLLMIYLSVELASLVSYIMAGYLADDSRSEESGLKYVLYGGIASGIMIFGMSLLFGLTGSLDLMEIQSYLVDRSPDMLVLFLTTVMILAGLGYKMAIAPFHMWSPDVYEGAPMPVTAFLSVASKAAAFAVTIRFFLVAFVSDEAGVLSTVASLDWQTLVAALAAITMTIGNVVAIQQHNIKRFLAYSSVAHAGYMLMGIAVQSIIGVQAIVFYFMIYFLMNLGAFLIATIVQNQFGTEEMKDYRGLVSKSSFGMFLSLAMAIFMFSLAGIPPFAGFIAKWYLFKAVVDANLVWLGVIGALNSVISLFYYVRLVKYMLIDSAEKDFVPKNQHWRYSALIAVFAVCTVIFGVYFDQLARWAAASSQFIH